jgi:signal peptidase I
MTSGSSEDTSSGPLRTAGHIALRAGGYLLILVVGYWLLTSSIVSVYYVSSGSMLPAIRPGDRVLVNEAAYGVRTPATFPLSATPVPWQAEWTWGGVDRGDVVLFRAPMGPYRDLPPSDRPAYVKRCVAIPGDTVRVREGQLTVHGRSLPLPPGTDSRERTWTVPARGDTLRPRRTPMPEPFLQSVTTRASRVPNPARAGADSVYVTRQNYYVVVGDNAEASRDSRHWGYLPQNRLIGEVVTKAGSNGVLFGRD